MREEVRAFTDGGGEWVQPEAAEPLGELRPWGTKEEALAAEIDADLWSTVFMHDTALMLPDLLRFDPALAALDHAVTQQRGSALGPLWAAPRKALLGRVDVWAEFEGSVRVPRWFRAAYRLAGGKRAELQFFADPEGARSALGERWAGVPFVEASRDPEFLEDLLRHGGELGLTVHARIPRPLDLAARGAEWYARLEPTLLNLKRRGYELGGHPVQVAAELAAIFEPSRLSLRGLVSAGYQPRPGLQVDTDELGKCLKTNLRMEDLVVDDYWLSDREARKHWSRVEKEERLARRGVDAASGRSSSGAESSASGEDDWTGESASEEFSASESGTGTEGEEPANRTGASAAGGSRGLAGRLGEFWRDRRGRRARRRLKVRSGSAGLKSDEAVLADLQKRPMVDLSRVDWGRVFSFNDGSKQNRVVRPHLDEGSEVLLEWNSGNELVCKALPASRHEQDHIWLGTISRESAGRAVFELLLGRHSFLKADSRQEVLAGAACLAKGYDLQQLHGGSAPPGRIMPAKQLSCPQVEGRFEMFSLNYGGKPPGSRVWESIQAFRRKGGSPGGQKRYLKSVVL